MRCTMNKKALVSLIDMKEKNNFVEHYESYH